MKALQCKGIIFDLDGVITQTAKLHFKAWKNTFDEYLKNYAEKKNHDFRPFDYNRDYIPFVDGRSRYQGVKAFLDSRGITIPYGKAADKPSQNTVCGVGNSKNLLFRKLVEKQGVDIYGGSIELIKELKEKGMKIAVATSSKNGSYILTRTGFRHLFDTVVDGNVASALKLKSKPEADLFVTAARRLKLRPQECSIAEDAIIGVEAGAKGNFGLVIGVARHNNEAGLNDHGADIVVSDMRQMSYKRISAWFSTKNNKNAVSSDNNEVEK